MHPRLHPVVQQILQRHDVSGETMRDCIGLIMDGACSELDIATLLTALAAKGPSVDELAGAAQAMRDRASGVDARRRPLLDTCGTGGDRLHTFNISTATAIVAAACGVPVAKHGNRSVSSSSGSADVLETLGVHIQLTPEQAAACLDDIGITFCFAPVVHGAMKHAAPVRRALGFPTIFNLLGPLTNPARAEYQLLGTARTAHARLIAHALSRLGCRRALVVCGNDELDEVCLWGPTTVFDVTADQVDQYEWQPEDFGLNRCDVRSVQVDTPESSARLIEQVLAGTPSPAADLVTASTAAALLAACAVESLAEAVRQARQALDSGAARNKLQELIDWTQNHR